MNATNRRHFIQQTALTAAAVTIASTPSLHATDASSKIVLGIIGPGGMGMNHLRSLVTYKDVEVAYVCEVDEGRANQAASAVEKSSGKRPQIVQDMRRIYRQGHWAVPKGV